MKATDWYWIHISAGSKLQGWVYKGKCALAARLQGCTLLQCGLANNLHPMTDEAAQQDRYTCCVCKRRHK